MFEPGVSGNPRGRPKGCCGGRIRALAGLDRMLAKKKNQQAMLAALEREFRDNPVRFFKTVVMPLLPREAKMSFDREGVIVWRSLLAAGGDGIDRRPVEGGSRDDVAGELECGACDRTE